MADDDHYETEQEMEAEALTAIFDTSFELTSAKKWAVTLYPIMDDAFDEDDENSTNHVGVKLLISIPATYPDVIPDLDIEILKGLAEEQRIKILDLANEEAEANVGMPAIFAISERIKEWLVDNNFKGQDDGSMYAQMMRRAKEAERSKAQQNQEFESQKKVEEMTQAEQEEYLVRKRREEGTPCTRENFLAWRDKFNEEMELLKQKELAEKEEQESSKKNNKKKEDPEKKLTGYQIFVHKIGLLEENVATGEEDEVPVDMEKLDIDEELFDDDEDLDDLDFDDDFDDDDDVDI